MRGEGLLKKGGGALEAVQNQKWWDLQKGYQKSMSLKGTSQGYDLKKNSQKGMTLKRTAKRV